MFKNIEITIGRRNRFTLWFGQFSMWIMMLGALWAADGLFGGSWAITFMVFFLGILWLVAYYKAFAARMTATFTPEELKQWVNDGMKENARDWERK